MAIAARKAEADALFRQHHYAAAVRAYGDALLMSEERRDPQLIPLIYANRRGPGERPASVAIDAAGRPLSVAIDGRAACAGGD